MRVHKSGTVLMAALIVPALLLPVQARSQQQADDVSPIMVGSRVRIQAPALGPGRITGTVIELDGESLLIGTRERTSRLIPRQAITRLDLSLGHDTCTWRGMLIGAGVGAALGAFIYYSGDPDSEDSWLDSFDTLMAATTVVAGPMFGAGIGALTKRDRWGEVPPEHVRVGLAAAPGGAGGLALTLRF
jgi:hypothetical protein